MDTAATAPAEAPVISLSDALNLHFELSEQIAGIQGRHKAELEPLLELLKAADATVHEQMLATNQQQAKLESGHMAFFQNNTAARVENFEQVLDTVVKAPALPGFEEHWDTILAHIRLEGNWHFLKKDVAKAAVEEFLEATGAVPTGIKWETFKKVMFRKGKG